MLTELVPDESHNPRARTLFEDAVNVLLINTSVVLRPTSVSETFGKVSVSLAVCVVASVVDVAVAAAALLIKNCFVLSAAL